MLPRTGKLGVARSVMAQAADSLPLEAFGLLHRLWGDLRWTPARKQISGWWWAIQPGQAVVFIADYARQFKCERRKISANLDLLVAQGWFRLEKTNKGCLLTCLRDPRDESALAPATEQGVESTVPNPPPADSGPPAPGGVEHQWLNPVEALVPNSSNTPAVATPGPRAAVLSPSSCKNPARAPEKAVAGAPMPAPEAVQPAESLPCAASAPPLALVQPVPEPEPPPRGPGGRPKAPPVPAVPAVPLVPACLAAVARRVGLTSGEAAREVLDGCPAKVVLAWLLCLARKRARVRVPGAFFRAGCRTRGEPTLGDLVDADRLLRGDLGPDPRARALAHQLARAIGSAWQPPAERRLSKRQQAELERFRAQFANRPGLLARLERELAARFPSTRPRVSSFSLQPSLVG